MASGDMHKNLVKIGRVVSELCERTDKQTNRYTHHSTSLAPFTQEYRRSMNEHVKACMFPLKYKMI